jgi:hypothetical protein
MIRLKGRQCNSQWTVHGFLDFDDRHGFDAPFVGTGRPDSRDPYQRG